MIDGRQIEDRGRGMPGGLEELDKAMELAYWECASGYGNTVMPYASQVPVKKRAVKRAAKRSGKG